MILKVVFILVDLLIKRVDENAIGWKIRRIEVTAGK